MEEGGRERVSLMEEEEFDGGKVVGRLGREGINERGGREEWEIRGR